MLGGFMQKLILIFTTAMLASCGMENPYAAKDKKCKYNCSNSNQEPQDSPRNHPRTTESPSTETAFWLNTFNTTNAIPLINGTASSDAKFISLIKTNPLISSNSLISIGALLARFRSDLEAAKVLESGGGTQSEDVKACLKNAFSAPWIQGVGTNIDFGKCIPLNNSMFTANSKTDNGGVIAYTEYEKNVALKMRDTMPAITTALDLRNTPPFYSLGSTSLTNDLSLSFYMSSIILQTAKEIQGNTLVGALREWSFASLGSSAENPFKIAYNSAQSQITLNGDVVFIEQTTLNPADDNSFSGQRSEGNFVQVSFQDFRLTGPQVQPNTNLGFSNSAILEGSYLVAVNYSTTKAGFRNHFVQVSGKGVACQADGFIVMTDNQGNPSKSDPFPIDLCAAAK
jgi:hypothetical protein